MARFERIDSEVAWSGKLATVRVDRFRYEDGEEAEREVVAHPGAVAILARDGDRLLPGSPAARGRGRGGAARASGREARRGRGPLATAKRELAEEIGKGARSWRPVKRFYTSPGFTDEECHIYLAEDLYDEHADSGENERIEIEALPLSALDDAIAECSDSKTLIGLLWLRTYLL